MIIRTRNFLRRIGLALGKLPGRLRRRHRGVEFRIVSCGDSDDSLESMPPPKETCAVASRLGDYVIWPACGHEDRQRFSLDFYGTEVEISDELSTRHGLCGDCLLKKMLEEKVVGRCALCGHAVLPGAPVTIMRDSSNFPRQSWKTHVDGGKVIGCLDMRCCLSGGLWGGYWAPGRVIPIDEACTSTRTTTTAGTSVTVPKPKE